MPKRRTEHPNDDKSSSHDTPILKRPRVEEKSTTGACASEAGDVHTRDSDVADEASVEALLLDTFTESVTMKRNAPVDVQFLPPLLSNTSSSICTGHIKVWHNRIHRIEAVHVP